MTRARTRGSKAESQEINQPRRDRSSAPGKRTLTRSRYPMGVFPPSSATDSGDRQAERKIASGGLEAASQPLPHLAVLQQAFGSHDLSDVRSQVGGPAAAAGAELGARAYTHDGAIGFTADPDVRVAAHEAAHAVQQRGGGGGGSTALFETQADAVADAVVQGRSVEHLLDRVVGTAGPSAVQRLASEEEVAEPQESWFADVGEAVEDMLAPFYGDAAPASMADSAGPDAVPVDGGAGPSIPGGGGGPSGGGGGPPGVDPGGGGEIGRPGDYPHHSWVDVEQTDGVIGQIFFYTDSRTLDSPDDSSELDELVAAIDALPKTEHPLKVDPIGPVEIRFVGHADYRAGDKYNMQLSLDRATAVRGFVHGRTSRPEPDYLTSFSIGSGEEPNPGVSPPTPGVGNDVRPDMWRGLSRRVDIHSKSLVQPELPPPPGEEPKPKPMAGSTRFRAKIVRSVSLSAPVGVAYGEIVIEDLDAHWAQSFAFGGLGGGPSVGSLPGGVSGSSEWQEFTVDRPCFLRSFAGPATWSSISVAFYASAGKDMINISPGVTLIFGSFIPNTTDGELPINPPGINLFVGDLTRSGGRYATGSGAPDNYPD